jgi:hypothetical protein
MNLLSFGVFLIGFFTFLKFSKKWGKQTFEFFRPLLKQILLRLIIDHINACRPHKHIGKVTKLLNNPIFLDPLPLLQQPIYNRHRGPQELLIRQNRHRLIGVPNGPEHILHKQVDRIRQDMGVFAHKHQVVFE